MRVCVHVCYVCVYTCVYMCVYVYVCVCMIETHFQRQLLDMLAAHTHDPLADHSTASEGDERDFRVGHHRLSCFGTHSKHNINHTWRQTWNGNKDHGMGSVQVKAHVQRRG